MASNQVRADQVLTAGIRAEFVMTYRQKYKGVMGRLANVMRLAIPSDKRQEIFAYFETAPYPRIWKRGENAFLGSFDSKQWTVVNYDWSNGVNWHEDDEQDDQTGSMFSQARMAGSHFATLDERIFFQILNGSTDSLLLPALPNSPDGADLFNATDGGGADRFGISGGNILSGQTLNTAAGIRSAFFDAVERLVQFQDPKGQPLHQPEELDTGGYTILYPITNSQIVREAFIQTRTLQVGDPANADTSGAAAVTNIVLDAGYKINLVGTSRMTGTTMALFANYVDVKPIFSMARQPLRETPYDRTNSDEGRFKKEKGILWDCRRGYGVALPYGCIQITT